MSGLGGCAWAPSRRIFHFRLRQQLGQTDFCTISRIASEAEVFWRTRAMQHSTRQTTTAHLIRAGTHPRWCLSRAPIGNMNSRMVRISEACSTKRTQTHKAINGREDCLASDAEASARTRHPFYNRTAPLPRTSSPWYAMSSSVSRMRRCCAPWYSTEVPS